MALARNAGRPRTPSHGTNDGLPPRFWLILLVGSLMLMLGDNMPLHGLLAYVPVYNLFHIPARHVWIFGLAFAWLAALGLDQCLPARCGRPAAPVPIAGVAFLLVLLTCIGVAMLGCSWPVRPWLDYVGFLIPLACGVAVVGVLATLSRQRRNSRALVPVLAFVELWLTIGAHGLEPCRRRASPRRINFPKWCWQLHRRDPGLPRCVVQGASWEHGRAAHWQRSRRAWLRVGPVRAECLLAEHAAQPGAVARPVVLRRCWTCRVCCWKSAACPRSAAGTS